MKHLVGYSPVVDRGRPIGTKYQAALRTLELRYIWGGACVLVHSVLLDRENLATCWDPPDLQGWP